MPDIIAGATLITLAITLVLANGILNYLDSRDRIRAREAARLRHLAAMRASRDRIHSDREHARIMDLMSPYNRKGNQ